MKTNLLLITLSLLSSVLITSAGEQPKPYTGTAEFEKLKTLAGDWRAKADMGQGPTTVTTQYRVIASGSALEERMFPNTPNEMVTLYHEKDGKLVLTHYCMLCNRPSMTLVKSAAKSLTFDLSKESEIKVDTEKHMHTAVITFVDADHVTQNWTLFDQGKAQQEHPFQFERVK
ncbi:hypothetical protein [Prosthecobacter sp.]|uniref:hypothetical protein n=1 Tax=Prosthecobacter sp. TaxID=1965333 RepID=UPI002489F3B6|nr:hypothetical protein [Prosthecobacter sp.]MDI1313485.1 hypothetical protein [Prosthecobacter sp.]